MPSIVFPGRELFKISFEKFKINISNHACNMGFFENTAVSKMAGVI
jgi:hypothetical protein